MNYDNYLKNAYVPNKEEIKYTQDNYVSRRVLLNELGGQVISSTWLKVSKYRDKHYINLPLKNYLNKSNNDKFKIMLSSCINRNINKINNATISLLVKLNNKNLNKNKLDNLLNANLIDEIAILASTNNIKINKEQIIKAINYQNIEELKSDMRFIRGLYEIFMQLFDNDRPEYSLKLISKWSWLLFGNEKILRKDIQNSKNTLSNYNYNSKNNDQFNEIEEFINDKNNYSMPIRITAIFCYCRLNKLFNEEYNDLFSLLSMYYVLSENNIEIFKYLKFTGTLFNKNINQLILDFKDANDENDDLTYILNTLIINYNDSLKQLNESIDRIIDETNLENYKFSSKAKNSIDEDDKNSAAYYLSKYPLISRKQAIFYVNHCKPNRYYSVKDFQDFCNACQETARYSLKNLVNLKLYQEEKFGKKFLYKAKVDNNDKIEV